MFYVHGRRFNGFHVRFRDIARGGLRLVTPGSVEQLAIEVPSLPLVLTAFQQLNMNI